MYISDWTKNDGYMEAKISFESSLPPVLLMRAVLKDDGSYMPIVREAHKGTMVASHPDSMNLEKAKITAVDLASKYLAYQAKF